MPALRVEEAPSPPMGEVSGYENISFQFNIKKGFLGKVYEKNLENLLTRLIKLGN